jgi:hypothetical protein
MHSSQASFTGDRQGLGDRDYCIAGENHRSKQGELSRCLNKMFLASRLAIANLRPEEEEE